MDKRVCHKIPYVSEFVSYEILRYIKKHKLPINVIFVPGTNYVISCVRQDHWINQDVRYLIVKSAIYWKMMQTVILHTQCIKSRADFVMKFIVEKALAHDRLSEHLQYASNPNKP